MGLELKKAKAHKAAKPKKRSETTSILVIILAMILLGAALVWVVWSITGGGTPQTPSSCFDFDSKNGVIKKFKPGAKKCGTDINIPDKIDGASVITIAPNAFIRADITGVIIPDSVKAIQPRAFAENKLESVQFGRNVETIGNGAFKNNQITSVVLPPRLKVVSTEVFASNQINDLQFGAAIEMINPSAFSNNKLSTLTIPDSVIYIRRSAFANNQLEDLKVGSKVKMIDALAFKNNPLKNIKIEGDTSRFDKQWERIGFPASLKSEKAEK